MSRALRWSFRVSLLANVLLVGILIGGLPHRFEPRRNFEERLADVLHKLPQDVQARFRESMERSRAEDGARREAIRAARERAIAILGAEPFDAAAYDREVQAIDALRAKGARDMAAQMRELAQTLPRDQRRVLAEALNRPPPQR